MYQHKITNTESITLPVGKVVCIGRNYAAHAKELNNPIPSTPILFMKPSTSMVSFDQPFSIPANQGEVHHEVEIAVLIGEPLTQATPIQAKQSIAGIGLALDLTLRDVQSKLKENGHPWEIAKAFDGSCPISDFVKPSAITDLTNISLSLHNNGELKQQGNSSDMLTPIVELLVHISQIFTLQPGDVVLTGTPAGVGPLHSGDQLVMSITDVCEFNGAVK
jgi:2-keto-4-pentenoate hydratase/2-oxohepta-3-ene-1,7-dioic acid hydratase in catechol pathway